MTTYTADDFKRAEFARHPDGRVAARNGFAYAPWWVRLPTGGSEGRSGDVMAAEGWVPVPAGSYTRTDEDGLTLLMVQQQRDQATARAVKAEQLARDRDDELFTAQKERDEARVQLRAEVERVQSMQTALAESLATSAQARFDLDKSRAEQPRPLTPDDITDEMVERAAHYLGMRDTPVPYWGDPDGTASRFRADARAVLTAALTEPTRPEGAEEIEAILDELPDTDLPITDAGRADLLAERGVRVPGLTPTNPEKEQA